MPDWPDKERAGAKGHHEPRCQERDSGTVRASKNGADEASQWHAAPFQQGDGATASAEQPLGHVRLNERADHDVGHANAG